MPTRGARAGCRTDLKSVLRTAAWPRKRGHGTRRSIVRCGLALAWRRRQRLADDMRVRIAWGGGADRLWQGTISVSDGRSREPQAAGHRGRRARLDVARRRCPTAVSKLGDPTAQPARLRRRRRAGRRAAARPKLRVQLSAADDPHDGPRPSRVPLADLSGEFVNKELDNRGNRLLVMRTPGDPLRVEFGPRQPGVCARRDASGSRSSRTLPLAEDGRARIKVQLLSGSGGEGAVVATARRAGRPRDARFPWKLPLPSEEGVYDVAHRGREQSELVAGGPPAVELEADDRRAAGATAGARIRSGRGRPAGRSRVRRRWSRSIRPIRGGSRSSTSCRSCS